MNCSRFAACHAEGARRRVRSAGLKCFCGTVPPTGRLLQRYLIAASFFKSMRLIHSCNSLGSWFCNSIWTK